MTKDTQNHTPQNGNTADIHGNTADVHTTEDTPHYHDRDGEGEPCYGNCPKLVIESEDTPQPRTVEAIAQEIQDHFFHKGAVVTKKDWDWLLTTLTTQHQALEARIDKAKQLAVLDYVPQYKTKEQFEMFIDSREKDIQALKDTIEKAEQMKKNLITKHHDQQNHTQER